MQVFRIQENTPEVYTNTSRDFQLIGRLYDCVINGIKFDADSILRIIDTESIDSKLLKLLQTKIGFFTSTDITDDDLRYVLESFPIIVKNKGSIKGIRQAVLVFLKLKHIKSDVTIDVFNKHGTHPYTVQISLNMPYTDTILLDEILKYVIPTGYVVAYSFYNDIGKFDAVMDAKIGANIIILKDSVNSIVRGNYISYKNTIEDRLIGSVGETQVALPYNTTYMGVVDHIEELPIYVEDKDKHVGELYTLRTGKPWEDDFSIASYMYIFNPTTSLYEWVLMNSTADSFFDVFRKAVYGYFNDNKFYENKNVEYTLDETLSQTGLRISNDSTPDSAVIEPFENGKLYNPVTDVVWYVYNNEWVRNRGNSYGVEIYGQDPNDEVNLIVPKKDLVVYREGTVTEEEAVWKTEIRDNEYVWGNIITDENTINELKEYSVATIIGNPDMCKIVSCRDEFLYNLKTDKSWYLDDGTWLEQSAFMKSIRIDGNPNEDAYIIPNENVHIYNDNYSWSFDGEEYADLVTPTTDVLYIDTDTSCGYKYDEVSGNLEEVLHFMKASNVYNVSPEELDYMIEYGLLKPAFKDEYTIFEDSFNNMFLL